MVLWVLRTVRNSLLPLSYILSFLLQQGSVTVSHEKSGFACVYFESHITTDYIMNYATYSTSCSFSLSSLAETWPLLLLLRRTIFLHDTPPTLRLTPRGHLFQHNKPAPIHSLHPHSTIFYITSFLGRNSIRLLLSWAVAESTDGEDQQGPEQDHDAYDSGSCGNKHLWCCIHIWHILYRCQVVHNSTTLPLIQPAHVAKGPDDINGLKSLPPRLQVERLRGDAALSVLLKGVHSRLPLLQVLGAIGALHYVRKALSSPQAVLRRVPSPTR